MLPKNLWKKIYLNLGNKYKNNLPVLPVTFLRCVPISPLNLSCEFKSSGSSYCSLHLMVNSSTHLFSCRILLLKTHKLKWNQRHTAFQEEKVKQSTQFKKTKSTCCWKAGWVYKDSVVTSFRNQNYWLEMVIPLNLPAHS